MYEKEMTLNRADESVRDVVGLRDTISGLFEDFFHGRPLMAARHAHRPETDFGWVPACDIQETDEEIVVLAAMPGVAKEDIQLEVKDGTLVLSGRRQSGDTRAGWLRRELPEGSFYRAFDLSSDVDAERVSAEQKNGILEVRLPKAERAKPRRVEIR